MKPGIHLFLLVVLAVLVIACTSVSEKEQLADDPAIIFCTDPRPQICTREYRPVCGQRDDASLKTYGNACTACGDPEVMGYRIGPCGNSIQKVQ